MLKTKRNGILAAVAAGALVLGGATSATAAAPTAAAACAGENSRVAFGAGGITGTQRFHVNMDSCAAQTMVDTLDDVQNASAFAAALGAPWWPVSFSTAPFIAWAWANQAAIRDCERAGTGIEFTEVNGIITDCAAQ